MNSCVFLGNVAHDLELKKTDKGVSYLNFRLVVSRDFNKGAGKGREVVSPTFEIWHTAAEFLASRAQKGTPIWLESSLRERRWEKEGKKMKTVKFRVNNFRVLA